MKKNLSFLFALFLWFSLLGIANAQSGSFKPTYCPEGYSDTKATWECGYVIVPEDHEKPQGKTIKLFVAKAKSRSSRPASDPVIFPGGPIGGGMIEAGSMLFSLYPDFTKDRDFIMFDQRGSGKSIPALECPELDEIHKRDFGKNLSNAEVVDHELKAIEECRKRLTKDYDLDLYNIIQTTSDMEVIRKALGYNKINIFSYSYGTSVTLTYMRMYPKNIRSVILDSTVPSDMWIYSNLLPGQANSLSSVFESCRLDKKCNAAYPDLKNVYSDLIKRLDSAPAKVTVANPHCPIGLRCNPVNIPVHGGLFSNYILNELFSANPIPRVPKFIYDSYTRNYASLAKMIDGQAGGEGIKTSWGRYYATVCYDNVFSENRETIEKSIARYPWVGLPHYQPVTLEGEIKSVCEKWVGDTAPPAQGLPVISDIPTLILQGQYDPYSPPSWGRHVYATLSNSYFYVFPGLTHVPILGEACPISIATQFVSDPDKEPNSSCIKSN